MDVLFVLALRARFEDLNADVRWTSACRQLDGGNSLILLSCGKQNAANLAGTSAKRISTVLIPESKRAHRRVCPLFLIHALDSIPKILPG